MGYMYEFPHSRMFDSDLREILEKYLELKNLPNEWETFKNLMTNNFEDLKKFTENYFDNLDVSAEINAKLDELIANGQLGEIMLRYLGYYTPEMYGAKGDGIFDDSTAINAMISDIKKHTPTLYFDDDEIDLISDFRNVKIMFTKQYHIQHPIEIVCVYGAVFNELNLTALPNFNGDCLFRVNYLTKNINFDNCHFDANWNVDDCVVIQGTTIRTIFTNSYMRHFNKVGLHRKTFNATKGHEIICNNCSFNQYEYGFDASMLDYGVCIKDEIGTSFDNHFNDCIFSYAKTNLIDLHGGPNQFNNCHFYGTPISVDISHFSNCYFDCTKMLINKTIVVTGCRFSGIEDDYYLIANSEVYNYLLPYAIISNNYFENAGKNAQQEVMDTAKAGYYWEKIGAIGNTFNNCSPLKTSGSIAIAPTPSARPFYTNFKNANKKGFISGNIAVAFGELNADGVVNFREVTEYELAYRTVILTPCTQQNTAYVTEVSYDSFTVAGTNGNKYNWLVIGYPYYY